MNIEVSKDNVKITNKEQIHKGEYQVNECNFTFSEEYSGLVKKVIFENKEEAIEILLVNDKCHIPNEILLGNQIEINLRVYGYEVEEENGESTLKLRYSPAYTTFMLNRGSYIENTSNTEPITPTDKEQIEQIVTNAINEIDEAVEQVNTAVEQVNTAIDEVSNLDLDVNKVDKTATVEITKKDNTTKSVNIYDGVSLQFMWSGTSLGIKTDNDSEYTFVNLQGVQGVPGPQGEPFRIKKTYSSVEAMNADFNNMQYGDYVMIASSVEVQDNAKLYTRGEYQWIFITDFSGATGIRGETGLTPNIQIGTVVSGDTPSVTRTGTDENPILNFTLVKGDKGETGQQGQQGETGNGVVGISKTSTSGLVDTYTMTYTNGDSDTFEVTNGQDGEVTQAQLDKVQADLDRYKTIENALPHVTGTGTNVTLDNTVNSILHLDLKGNTSQDSTSKIIVSDITTENGAINSTTGQNYGNQNRKRIAEYLNSAVVPQTLSWDGENVTCYVYCYDSGKNPLGFFGNEWSSSPYTFTPLTNTAYIRAIFKKGSDSYPSDLSNVQLQIENAPLSPQFPIDIHIVTGNNTIKVQNKNFFDKNNTSWYRNNSGSFDNTTDNSTTRIRTNSFKLNGGKTYTISGIPNGISLMGVRTYNEYGGVQTFGATITGNRFVLDNEVKYIHLLFGGSNFTNDTNTLMANANIQIEEGNQATSYEAYQEQSQLIRLGGNLFNENKLNLLNGFVNYNTGVFTAPTSSSQKCFYIKVLPNTQIQWENYNTSGSFGYGLYTDTPTIGTTANSFGIITSSNILTIGSNDNYLVMFYSANNVTNELSQFTLTQYGTTPLWLGKIGDYQDYFYKSSGKWYLHKEIGKTTFVGSNDEGWVAFAGAQDEFQVPFLPKGANDSNNQYFIAKAINFINHNVSGAELNNYEFSYFASSQNRWLRFRNNNITTLEDWKTWLGTHNIEVVYELVTPTNTEITDTTLIGQLDNIEQLMSYEGQTNILQENNDLGFIISASALKDISNL